jgi:site-specific DNA-methyltransferase (adenine-specific)
MAGTTTVSRRAGAAANVPRMRIEHLDAIALLRSLDDESVDLIVTDPAYSGMNRHLSFGHGRIVGKYDGRGDGEQWFDEFEDTPENYAAFLTECHRVLKPNRHIFIMFDSYSMLTLGGVLRDHFDVKNIVTWDKINIGMGHYFRRQTEFILFASKGKRPLSRRDIPDVWRIRRIHRASYPTQKPTELFEAMIAASIHEGDDRESFVVCDPFLGSGSAAVAAHRQGCSFIGGDVAEASLDAAALRLTAMEAGDADPLQPQSAITEQTKVFW